MVRAAVTFDVELTENEATAMEYARDGLSDADIAARMKVPLAKLQANFEGLHLANTLNLVEATRKGYVTWEFRRSWEFQLGVASKRG